MSKTVDDLIGVYIEASNAVVWEAEKRGLCPMTLDMQRAGIAAVVRELRDEICERIGCVEACDIIDEILGDTAEARSAGGSTREGEQAVQPDPSTPATDPALVFIDECAPVSSEAWQSLKRRTAPAVCNCWSNGYAVCRVTYSGQIVCDRCGREPPMIQRFVTTEAQ